MNDKDFKKLSALAKEQLRRIKKMSEQEARQSLVATGIFNPDGSFTKPYRDLAKAKSKGH